METTNGKNFLELRRGKGQNHFTNKKTSRAWVIGGITTGEAAKILANLIVMGSGILIRGMVQAYRQALQNASKSGVAQETIQNVVRRGSKVMTEQEARQILGVTEQSSWEEIAQKYDNLLSGMQQMAVFICNQRFTGLRNAWRRCREVDFLYNGVM
ncbi:hypothetical protein R6Q59_031409 [Mikania micrantha]